jgi:hypothetical protein
MAIADYYRAAGDSHKAFATQLFDGEAPLDLSTATNVLFVLALSSPDCCNAVLPTTTFLSTAAGAGGVVVLAVASTAGFVPTGAPDQQPPRYVNVAGTTNLAPGTYPFAVVDPLHIALTGTTWTATDVGSATLSRAVVCKGFGQGVSVTDAVCGKVQFKSSAGDLALPADAYYAVEWVPIFSDGRESVPEATTQLLYLRPSLV